MSISAISRSSTSYAISTGKSYFFTFSGFWPGVVIYSRLNVVLRGLGIPCDFISERPPSDLVFSVSKFLFLSADGSGLVTSVLRGLP